jgi:hypothetical protein
VLDDDDDDDAIGGKGADRVNGCCDDRVDNGGGSDRAAVIGIVDDNDVGVVVIVPIRSFTVRPARISPCVKPPNRSLPYGVTRHHYDHLTITSIE